jgi:uncharacterized DUF497 family protein
MAVSPQWQTRPLFHYQERIGISQPRTKTPSPASWSCCNVSCAARRSANVARHRVWFQEAESFEWETAVIEVDDRKRYGESRFRAMGYIDLRLYVMVFTLRDTAVRLISLRKANPREVKRYAQT